MMSLGLLGLIPTALSTALPQHSPRLTAIFSSS